MSWVLLRCVLYLGVIPVEVDFDSEFIGVWVLAGGDLVVLYDAACWVTMAGGFMDVVAVGGQE